MPTNSYDLIVIGDDFAGLVAGTLCAKRGLRVLLLSEGRPAGYQLGPHQLPFEPLALGGVGNHAIRRVLDELNLLHILKRKLREAPSRFQFVAPDIRLDIASDDLVLGSELHREFGNGDTALAALLRTAELSQLYDEILAAGVDFPPSGFFKKREVGRMATTLAENAESWFDEIRDDPILHALVGVATLISTRVGPQTLSPGACARNFHLWHAGAPRVRGDWDTLREVFRDKLSQGNGEIRIGRPAELTFSWGKVNGVRLESGEELGAGHVISAAPVSELLPIVGRKVPKRLSQCVDALTVGGYRYTLNLVVDEAGIPEGMGSHVFLVSDTKQPPWADNGIAIYVGAPDKEARVVVSVSAICPPVKDSQDLDNALADLRVGMRERIELVMPFFSEHVLLAHAPHETAPPEGINADPGKGLPVAPTPMWESTLDPALGVSAVPYSVGIKHLTVASSQVLPQLGVEGDFITGWCAARAACDALGRKRDYLKDEVIASG